MVKIGDISIDGSKLRANASSKRSKEKVSGLIKTGTMC